MVASGCVAVTAAAAHAQSVTTARSDTISIAGLQQPVEILRDRWGVSHIYAKTEHDLFFAQGYTAARDRAFQFEMWRRQATGTMAEIAGRRELKRDQGARLFKFRGSMATEMAHYHPHGASIIGAFVDGVNAAVDEAVKNPALIPAELRMLGLTPGRWTPEVVISRHQGLLGNIGEELAHGRFVATHGAALLQKIQWFHPGPVAPVLALDPTIDGRALDAPILELYDAFRAPVRFQPSDLRTAFRNDTASARRLATIDSAATAALAWNERRDIGSNNWVVAGSRTLSGRALMANDPHRAQAAPGLRYFVHLVAPGWNVIGGGEPVIPGVSIGHNEHGAWGLTVFGTDGEDLYVYKTNPANAGQYQYRGAWEPMRIVRETVPVKGEAASVVTLKYTRHGPVVYEDTVRHIAYAVRAAWMEPGGAPYMASLRMDQAQTWEQFRDACSYSNIPGENMVWADVAGNIGWQAVGIAPIRPRSSGLVPVPGDGRFDWAGYLPIKQKPHAYNPPDGYIATANNNLTPENYPYRDAIGWSWADPYRFARIAEVLGAGRRVSMMDMMRLQNDYTSIPARSLVPLLADLPAADAVTEQARLTLLGWDRVLDKGSTAAGVYEAWYRQLTTMVTEVMVPAPARSMARGLSTKRVIEWLTAPGGEFGTNPTASRDSLLLRALRGAVDDLTQRYGADVTGWSWGRYHKVLLQHPMSAALDPAMRARFEVGPWPRGGDGNTPGATGGGEFQTSGASFRYVVEAGDWDASVGTNTPGQSGDVESPHYRDLFELWKNDRYFPVKYSRGAVESVTEARMLLAPRR
ncbi:MAG: penicillin acylase family protein [Polaromonas sp.]|nr:penicillin acylase family protein [Gemmatimonadaceae bacterium]